MFRFIASLLLLGSLTVPVPALAATSKSKSASKTAPSSASSQDSISKDLTHSYNADNSVQTGMVVELNAKDPSSVLPVPDTDISKTLGVVIPASNAAIVLSPQTPTKQQVLVSSTGRYGLLVSNQNGPVKPGDLLTISSIAGVAMKASDQQTQLVGHAAGTFSGTANVIGSVALKNTIGKTTNVALGRVPTDIGLAHNPLFQKTPDYVPQFIAKVASGVANHPVSAARIYLGLSLIFATTIITGNMLYSGVRSGMTAVGRNPLSKKSIIRSLIQTVIAGLIIFVAGVFAVYLLLKL